MELWPFPRREASGIAIASWLEHVGVRGLSKRAHRAQEVRAVVTGLRPFLQRVRDGGAQYSEFMERDMRALERELSDLAAGVHDKKLKRLCAKLLEEYVFVFRAAPAVGDHFESGDATRRRNIAIDRQRDGAATALETVGRVLTRIGQVERHVGSRV